MRARPRQRREDRGASSVEYGLMVAAVTAVIVGVAFSLGTMVKHAFEHTCDALYSQTQPDCIPIEVPGPGASAAAGADPALVSQPAQ